MLMQTVATKGAGHHDQAGDELIAALFFWSPVSCLVCRRPYLHSIGRRRIRRLSCPSPCAVRECHWLHALEAGGCLWRQIRPSWLLKRDWGKLAAQGRGGLNRSILLQRGLRAGRCRRQHWDRNAHG